jgi:hypothetical protein
VKMFKNSNNNGPAKLAKNPQKFKNGPGPNKFGPKGVKKGWKKGPNSPKFAKKKAGNNLVATPPKPVAAAAPVASAAPVVSSSPTSNRMCGICKRHVPEGEGSKVDGEIFHKTCMKCSECLRPISGEFISHPKGGFCCNDCEKYLLEEVLCGKCGKTMVGTTVVFKKKEYHKACFGCFVCGASFGDEGFLTNDAGDPVCDDHVKSSAGPIVDRAPPVKPLKPPKMSVGSGSGSGRGGISSDTMKQLGLEEDSSELTASSEEEQLAPKNAMDFVEVSAIQPAVKTPPPPPPGRRR